MGLLQGDEKRNTTIVENELASMLKNETENIQSYLNDITKKVTSDMVSTAKSDIQISQSVGNTANIGGNIKVSGPGSTLSFIQDATLTLEARAVIKIVSDQSKMNDLVQNIASELNRNTETNNKLKQAADNVAKIKDSTVDGGGPEGMVRSATDILKAGSNEITETELRNSVRNTVINRNVDSNEVKNILTTEVSNAVRQAGESRCGLNISANNTINSFANFEVTEGGKFDVNQKITLNSFQQCMVDLNLGQKVVDKLIEGAQLKSTSTTTTTNETDQSQKTSADISKEKEMKSGIMDFLSNVLLMIPLIICAVCIPIIAGIFLMGGSGGEDEESYGGGNVLNIFTPTENFDGGALNFNESNVYLYVSLIAVLLFTYSKSIPACGVILAVLIGYILYKNKDL